MRVTSRPARTRLRSTHYGDADAIITNPPYTRELMHTADRALPAHRANLAANRLRLVGDQAGRSSILPHCSDIVVLPRLKWFEGSKDTGKDNHAWYRFDARHSSGPVFHWRDRSKTISSRRVRVCEQCRKSYEPQRTSSRFCSPDVQAAFASQEAA